MSLLELFIIAVALSMDAFAASVCLGLAQGRISLRQPLIAGAYFGFFQALMPLLGFFAGTLFADEISSLDHWIAFALLLFIGGKMIKESFEKGGEDGDPSLSVKRMLTLAIATSIDALAAGVTFAIMRVHIVPATAFIGSVTFIISAAGVKIGGAFGARFKSKAELLGGAVLVIMGIKILAEHLVV